MGGQYEFSQMNSFEGSPGTCRSRLWVILSKFLSGLLPPRSAVSLHVSFTLAKCHLVTKCGTATVSVYYQSYILDIF